MQNRDWLCPRLHSTGCGTDQRRFYSIKNVMKTFFLEAFGRLRKPGAHLTNSTHLPRDEPDTHAVLRTLCPRNPPSETSLCSSPSAANSVISETMMWKKWRGPSSTPHILSSPLHCASISFHHDPNTITCRPCGF